MASEVHPYLSHVGGLPSMVVVHVAGPPAGSVDASMFPNPSVATQSAADADESPDRVGFWGSCVETHAPGPPVGSVVVKTASAVAAAQKPDVGHETATTG